MILNPFKGKSIFITGGSSGIGLEMALEFARLGANIAVVARDKERLTDARRALEDSGGGGRVLAYACDVTDAETLRDYVNMARYEFGALDGVVANAGYCHPGRFHEIALGDFDRQIDTNLKGATYAVRCALPHLLESGGGFVALVSSPAGNAGFFGFGAYGPTKAALNNLSEVLRSEYGDRGIRVHLLLAPDTDTPGYAREVQLYPPETRAILDGGSLHQPGDVARAFVTGIANHKKVVTVGVETKYLLTALRFAPFLWNLYVRRKKKDARRANLTKEPNAESKGKDSESPSTPREESV
jgi:3-dehydrosphinganine reductase